MKFFTLLLTFLFLTVSCSERREVVYVDRDSAPAVEPMPQVLYSNCYVPGRGFLGDDGYYYPHGYTYRCNGVVYRSGVRYSGSLLGAMAVGYYFGSMGPGYGNYGVHHTNVTNVKNVRVIKKGSPEYKKRTARYNKIQNKRNKNNWISKSEKKRRAAQSKRDKARHRRQMAKQQKKQKSSFSRSASKSKTVRKKSYSRPTKSRSSSRSWSRSSSRSSFRSSRRSDARLKENLVPLDNARLRLHAIKGYYYNYIGEEERTLGVLAQDVEKVYPELVEVNEDGFRSVHYDLFVPILLEAFKENTQLVNNCIEGNRLQLKQIKYLKKEIDFLKKQLNNK